MPNTYSIELYIFIIGQPLFRVPVAIGLFLVDSADPKRNALRFGAEWTKLGLEDELELELGAAAPAYYRSLISESGPDKFKQLIYSWSGTLRVTEPVVLPISSSDCDLEEVADRLGPLFLLDLA